MLITKIKKICPKVFTTLVLIFLYNVILSQDTIAIKSKIRELSDTILGKHISNGLVNNLLVQYTDSNNFVAVDYLLSNGANPNATYEESDITPLMYAAQNGNYKISKLLIDKGADVNLVPWDGNSALFAAVRSGNDSITELLLDSNALVNIKNGNGLTPLHYAVGYGYPFITGLLLYYGANPDTLDQYGNSPLMTATYSGAYNCAKILLEYHARVDQQDKLGNTPLMVATQFNDTLFANLLIQNGTDITIKNKRNNDAISYAINSGSHSVLKLLLHAKNSLGLNPQEGNNYYQQAKENGLRESLAILNNYGYKSEVSPIIQTINFYSGFELGSSDFMYDYGGGIYEPISKMLLNVGFKFRPYSIRVQEFRNMEYYQFWEKRYSLYISANYSHYMFSSYKSKIGLIAGFNLEYSWSDYRGTKNDKDNMTLLVPTAGIFYKKELFMLIAKWLVTDYKTDNFDKNRFGIQFVFTIPTNKNRVINKKINWLNE